MIMYTTYEHIIVKEKYKGQAGLGNKRDLLLNIPHLLIYLCLLYESTAECILAHLAAIYTTLMFGVVGAKIQHKSRVNEAPLFILYIERLKNTVE